MTDPASGDEGPSGSLWNHARVSFKHVETFWSRHEKEEKDDGPTKTNMQTLPDYH